MNCQVLSHSKLKAKGGCTLNRNGHHRRVQAANQPRNNISAFKRPPARFLSAMILQYVASLNTKRIVLASGSPRRKELLGNIGLKFEIIVSSFEETLPHHWFENAADYAVETAKHKALDVAQVVAAQQGAPPVDLIISADTIVEHDGYILEKPDDADHAHRMLSSLSGSSHHVHTGVALVLPQVAVPEGQAGPFCRTFSTTTNVIFHELSPELIEAYIATGEPFGKAGSYGIQGAAASFVTGISGCYFNVVGFPINAFSQQVLDLIKDGYLPLEGSVLHQKQEALVEVKPQ